MVYNLLYVVRYVFLFCVYSTVLGMIAISMYMLQICSLCFLLNAVFFLNMHFLIVFFIIWYILINIFLYESFAEIYNRYISYYVHNHAHEHWLLLRDEIIWSRIDNISTFASNYLLSTRMIETPYLLLAAYDMNMRYQYRTFIAYITNTPSFLTRPDLNLSWTRSTRELSRYYFENYIMQMYMYTLVFLSRHIYLSKSNAMLSWCYFLEDLIIFYSSLRDKHEYRLSHRDICSGQVFHALSLTKSKSYKEILRKHVSFVYSICCGIQWQSFVCNDLIINSMRRKLWCYCISEYIILNKSSEYITVHYILSAARIVCTQVQLIRTLNNICNTTFFYELCIFVKALMQNRINAVNRYQLRVALRNFCEQMDLVDNAFMDDINTFCMVSISNWYSFQDWYIKQNGLTRTDILFLRPPYTWLYSDTPTAVSMLIKHAVQLCDSKNIASLFPQLSDNAQQHTCEYAMLSGLLGEESMGYTWSGDGGRNTNELSKLDVDMYKRSAMIFNSSLWNESLYTYNTCSFLNELADSDYCIKDAIYVRWNWSMMLQWQLLLYGAYPFYSGITCSECYYIEYIVCDLYRGLWARNNVHKNETELDSEYACMLSDIFFILESIGYKHEHIDFGMYTIRDYYSDRYDRTNDDYALSFLSDSLMDNRWIEKKMWLKHKMNWEHYAGNVLVSDFFSEAHSIHVSASSLCIGLRSIVHKPSTICWWHMYVSSLADAW